MRHFKTLINIFIKERDVSSNLPDELLEELDDSSSEGVTSEEIKDALNQLFFV